MLVIILSSACTPAVTQGDTTTVIATSVVQNMAIMPSVPGITTVASETELADQVSETPFTEETSMIIAETPANEDESPEFSEYTSGSLWLRLFDLFDEKTFSEGEITIIGQAPSETVISLNDEICLVNEDEEFSVPVELEEGPNVLEIVASNLDGDEIDLVLTVIYDGE